MSDDLATETEPLIDLDALERRAMIVSGHLGSATVWMRDPDEPLKILATDDVTGWDGTLIAETLIAAHAEHIAGVDPKTVLELVSEVRKAREASSHFDTLMGFMVRLAEVAGEQPPSSLVDGVEDLVDATITKMVTGEDV